MMMIVINEDNDNFFKYPEKYMTEASLRKYIDFYGKTCVTHFFMCPNGQRTSYRSNVHEAIWDELPGNVYSDNIWAVNAKKLFDQGIDPYHVWIDQCRKNRISPWITMRMNDVHFCDNFHYFRNTNFHRNHPELHRVPPEKSIYWEDYGFDYSKKPAYDYHMALFKELVNRYDADGYELDWMRWPAHLTPGKEYEQRQVLTDFIVEARNYLDRNRGKNIPLSVRVQSTPRDCARHGFDVPEWIRQARVELIVISDFFLSAEPEYNYQQWTRFLGKEADKVTLLPSFNDGSAPAPGLPRTFHDAEKVRGWADTMLSDGFQGLYFFNLPYNFRREQELACPPEDSLEKLFSKDFSAENISGKKRTYFISFRESSVFHDHSCIQLPAQFPARLTIRAGKMPYVQGMKLQFSLSKKESDTFWIPDASPAVSKILFNGVSCAFTLKENQLSADIPAGTALQERNCIEIDGSSNIEILSAQLSVL